LKFASGGSLADEDDSAQERREVATSRDGDHRRSDKERRPTAADVGLSRKQIHEARAVRDAESWLCASGWQIQCAPFFWREANFAKQADQ
jgi:hypothetical protein